MPPPDEMAALIAAGTCNHFSMWLPDYTSYGTIANPFAALVNHSCTPNIVRGVR